MAKILLVDDDRDQLELRRMLLERAGHKVYTAETAATGLELLERERPDVVVTDLRLPDVKDGAWFIRRARAERPESRLAVLSGFAEDLAGLPEGEMVDEVMRKPVRSPRLLAAIAKLAVCLVCWLAVARGADQGEYPFRTDAAVEVVADLELSAPGADWGRPGREAAMAALALDGAGQQHVMVYGGAARHHYQVFLGPVEAGAHVLKIERQPEYSARGVYAEIHGVTFRQYKPEDAEYAMVAHAPVIFARPNTLRKFSDIPLITYCERLGDGSLRYSVIFSNEDGGTSTRGLMARWGRATDIEHVYQVWPAKGAKATIQTRDHKDVEFRGEKAGLHPLLGVVTDNNMVAADAKSAVRYQLAPVMVDLNAASREQVMDDHPFTYLISARELEREGRIRPYGTVEGTKISNPENYLFVELRAATKDARLAVLVRLEGEKTFRASNLGEHDLAIERSGWMRTAVEMPPATQAPQVAELALACLPERNSGGAGSCRVDAIRKVFFLDAQQRPGENFFRPRMDHGPWTVAPGQMRLVGLR